MLTTRTKPAPENLGAWPAFIIVTAKTGPVIISTSKEARNAAAEIEAVFLIIMAMAVLNLKFGYRRGETGWNSFSNAGLTFQLEQSWQSQSRTALKPSK